MVVVVDTSFAWGLLSDRDPRERERASAAFRDLSRGKHGLLVTNDYVYGEATALAARFGARSVRDVDAFFLGPDALVQVQRVDQRLFEEARRRLLAEPERGLSLTDWSLVALAHRLHAKAIATFDARLGAAYGRMLPGP